MRGIQSMCFSLGFAFNLGESQSFADSGYGQEAENSTSAQEESLCLSTE